MNYITSILVFLLLYVCQSRTVFEHDRAVYKAQKGQHEQALSLLKQVIAEKPNDATSLYDAGVVAYTLKDTDQAYAYFSSVTKQADVPVLLQEQARYNRAVIHAERKEYDKGIEQCDQILQLSPDHQRAKELKSALEKLKQQKQQKDQQNDQSNKKQEKQNNAPGAGSEQQSEQKDNKQGKQQNTDSTSNDKKDQGQTEQKKTEKQDKQESLNNDMEHEQHQDTDKSMKKDAPQQASPSQKKVTQKTEKQNAHAGDKKLEPMLERVLAQQEKASQESLKKFLKGTMQERKDAYEQNAW